ncbi:hypothetical protein BOX15_Mlig003707g4 [Macrostomum lignano]|uniref:LRRCT domain-containing protein n=1 Tax=Macrostomum lignano TaxID=282301 RepID=A0A267DMG0_9PLAT|nr:hypothetical protein BOX15_Mlig003707g4 [Macrostomum lignano]
MRPETLLPLLLLLLLPPVAVGCPWRFCHSVQVKNIRSSSGGGDYRMLTAHECRPSNNFPERCHLHETAYQPDRVLNFTMRRAQLSEAPLSGFCQFDQLSGLDLAENLIAEFRYPAGQLSDRPGCLSRLRWLSLRANRLREADISQFLRLPGLEQLDLSDNRQLESLYLSEALQSQSGRSSAALKTILASRCRIKQVDISLVRLPSLQDIDLSYNRVSRVTDRLRWRWTPDKVAAIAAERNWRRTQDPNYYARLSVQLVQNRIGPEAFADGRTLWGLPVPSLDSDSDAATDAVVNALKLYRDAFRSFLYIDNTDSTVTCDCRLLSAWSFLRRVHRDPDEFSRRNALSLAYWLRLRCDPASLPGGGYVSRKNITSLADTDLRCEHTDDCPTGCGCTERVMPSELTLKCRGAGLSALPRHLPASVHPVRYNLLLADNRISSLKFAGKLANASLVQRIDLSRNRITAATDFAPLAAFTSLHWLNLSGNPLLSLPPSLLNLASAGRATPPRVDLGASVTVRCSCSQLEPDAWERQRRLLGDGIRGLRCFGAQGEPEPPAEFRLRKCVQRPNTTNSVVVREQQIVDQSVILWAGIGSVLLFLLALVAVVFAVLRYRRSQDTPDKAPPTSPPLQPPSTQPMAAMQGQLPMLWGSAGGCVSPDYVPPGGCGSPYDSMTALPRYARDPASASASALFLLRGGVCANPAGGSANFPVAGRLGQEDDSDDFSSEDEGAGCGAPSGSDPAIAGARCPLHRPDSWRGAGDQRRGGGRLPATRLLVERELLLPPPLPPRTQPLLQGHVLGGSAAVTLTTDV